MLENKGNLVILFCVIMAIYFTGCPLLWILTPETRRPEQKEEREKENPKVVEKEHYDDRGVGHGKKNPDGTEGNNDTPPVLKKGIPDLMSKYHRAVELDKQGKTDEAYRYYEDFVNSAPDVEGQGKLEDPRSEEERRKAMEHAKERLSELSKQKRERQQNQ